MSLGRYAYDSNSSLKWVAVIYLITLSLIQSAQGQQSREGTRIVTLHAMPYYPATGVIRRSTDLFDKRLVLRNVIIPAGSAGDPLRRQVISDWDIVYGTTVTYVEVEIESANFEKVSSATQVGLTAQGASTKKNLMSETVLLSKLSIPGVHSIRVPFFIYGTGCEELEIQARIIDGGKVRGKLTRSIPFSCGE